MWKHLIVGFVFAGALGAAALPASFARAQDGSQDAAAEQGDEVERGDPFLWRIERGETTAFLFGTVHLPDERILDLAPEVEAAFGESTAFFAEIEATAASTAAVQRRAMLPKSESLPDIIGPELWGRVEGELRAAGLQDLMIQGMQRMEPWAVGAMLPTLDYLDAQLRGVKPLDAMLFDRALAEEKPARGLETVDEQVSVFESFDQADQVRMLAHTLDQLAADRRKGVSTIETTVRAWLSGDEDALLDVLDDSFAVDPDLRARIEEELIWKRNLRFAERIEDAIAAAPAEVQFFAIGALHMPDPREADEEEEDAPGDDAAAADEPVRKGLVTLLERRGFTLTRVRAAVPAGAGR